MATPKSEFKAAEDMEDLHHSEPSLGDLSDLDNLNTMPDEPNLGEALSFIDNDEHSEILGDISLLEEAIAELETEAAHESVAETADEENPVPELEDGHDALQALLDDEEISHEQEDPISALDDESVPTLQEEVDLTNTVIAFNQEQEATLGNQTIPVLDDIAEMGTSSSIAEQDEEFSFSDIPNSQSPELDLLSSGTSSEIPLEMPLESATEEQSEISELDIENMENEQHAYSEAFSEPRSEMTKSVEHHVSVGNNTSLSISIPYELHSQLSKKIDGLVIEAATSITNELHHQLSTRMEGLLNQAVESVLPTLMDQMANGLRKEVKQKVRAQLPNIINDVLSKTRLTEETN